jgi:multicomponent Na+:H+ antiporter subunit G
MTPLELAVAALLAGGVFFGLVAVVGLLRLPDLYTRAHAASKSDTLGAVLSFAAVALVFGADLATAKVVFLLVFMFLTNPTAAHAITRAAFDQGIEPWTVDESDREARPDPGTDADDADGSGAVATDGGSGRESNAESGPEPGTESSRGSNGKAGHGSDRGADDESDAGEGGRR